MLHPDVYAHDRDQMLIFDRVTENGVIEDHGRLNSFIHLQHPNIGDIMRSVMKPSERMQGLIDVCVHIHANNGPVQPWLDVNLPLISECTFVRKDLVTEKEIEPDMFPVKGT